MSTAVLTAVAWAYKNGARHIGHKSGSGVASGVFARCHRMAGDRVLMVSGTDEPQGLPEVDAPFASGESVVSFQRPWIAGGAQPVGVENLRHLGRCFAERRRLGHANGGWRASLVLVGVR